MEPAEAAPLVQRQLADLQARMVQNMRRFSESPALGAQELEELLAVDLPAAKHEMLELSACVGPIMPEFPTLICDQLAKMEASLRLTLGMGRHRLGQNEKARTHLQTYFELVEGQRDPGCVMALTLLTRLELEDGRADLAREHLTHLEPEVRWWLQPTAWEGIVPPGQEDAQVIQAERQLASTKAMLAEVDLAEGDRKAYLQHSAEALELAERTGDDDQVRVLFWARASHELIWDSTGERLDRADLELRTAAPPRVREHPDFKRRLLQLRAHVWANRGRPAQARAFLSQALAGLPPADPAGWSFRLDLADALSAAGENSDALAEARLALELARRADSPVLVRRCADHVRGLVLASGEPAAIEEALAELDADPEEDDASDRASRLRTRVQLLMALERPREAFASIDELAVLPAQARERASITDSALAIMRSGALRLDGKVGEAVLVLEGALEQEPASGGAGGCSRETDQERRRLALGAAFQRAELGHVEAALHWSERAREPLWRSTFERHGIGGVPLDLSQLARRLRARRAAVLVLVPGHTRTAALVVSAEGLASARMLPPGEKDWSRRFADMERGEACWNPRFAENLSDFSAWLGPVLAGASAGADLLYVVPEGVLALVPYAGLLLPDGRPLAAVCPSAVLPALRFALRDAPPPTSLPLLSAGAGSTFSRTGDLVHDFSAMARGIAELFGADGAVALPDAELGRFLSEAPRFGALHLSFHGNVQPGKLDPLASSTLEFKDQKRLSARRLAEHFASGVDFEHVFVNACLSAGYAFARDAGAGGFWQALLSVGARAVTGTLAYVDPSVAQEIAVAFCRHWSSGNSVPRSLFLAQSELEGRGLARSAWSTHMTVVTYLC